MAVFSKYSQYYNLIYNHKEYSKDADFVDCLLKKYCFIPEVDLLLQNCGMHIVETGKWLRHEQPDVGCLNAYFVVSA